MATIGEGLPHKSVEMSRREELKMLAKENRFGSVLSGFCTPIANQIVTEFTSFLSAEFPLFFMIPSLEVQDFKKDSSRETAQHQARLMSEHRGTISRSVTFLVIFFFKIPLEVCIYVL